MPACPAVSVTGPMLLGVIAGVEWLGVALRGYLQLRLDIRPAFTMLDQRIDSRLWQDKSPLEIIDEVLNKFFLRRFILCYRAKN